MAKKISRNEFVNYIIKLVTDYRKTATTEPDFFDSVTIAQAIHETGYGTSELYLGFNNAFGYKAKPGEWSGKVAGDYKSDEEINGVVIKDVPSDFRAYESVAQSVADHANMMTRLNGRYLSTYKVAIDAKTPEAQAHALTGRYAGDSKYGAKLVEIMDALNLYQYDTQKEDDKVTQKRTFKDVAKKVYGTEVINWDGFKGIGAGSRGGNPKGAIIHNDYGRANGKGYISWLASSRIPNPSAGYAHYYHDRKYAVRAVPTTQGAWHAGDFARGNFTGHGKPANYGNMKLIGYEVNESLSTTQEQFRLNEEVVFMQVAEDFLFYGIKPSRQTVWLHREYTSTTCPHRSWDIHVGGENSASNRNKLKDYFVGRIQFWMDVLEGKKDIPTKNYLPEKHGEVASEPANVTNPQGMKSTEQKPYKAPRIPWDKHEIGDVVEIAKNFQWFDTATYELLQSPNYGTIVGTKDKVVEIMQIPDDKQGNHSRIAYKLEKYNSWILEEYIVESMDSWELVEEDENHVDPTPPAPSYDGNYVHWDGKSYKVGEEIK